MSVWPTTQICISTCVFGGETWKLKDKYNFAQDIIREAASGWIEQIKLFVNDYTSLFLSCECDPHHLPPPGLSRWLLAFATIHPTFFGVLPECTLSPSSSTHGCHVLLRAFREWVDFGSRYWISAGPVYGWRFRFLFRPMFPSLTFSSAETRPTLNVALMPVKPTWEWKHNFIYSPTEQQHPLVTGCRRVGRWSDKMGPIFSGWSGWERGSASKLQASRRHFGFSFTQNANRTAIFVLLANVSELMLQKWQFEMCTCWVQTCTWLFQSSSLTVKQRLAWAAALHWYARRRLQRETLRFNFPPFPRFLLAEKDNGRKMEEERATSCWQQAAKDDAARPDGRQLAGNGAQRLRVDGFRWKSFGRNVWVEQRKK